MPEPALRHLQSTPRRTNYYPTVPGDVSDAGGYRSKTRVYSSTLYRPSSTLSTTPTPLGEGRWSTSMPALDLAVRSTTTTHLPVTPTGSNYEVLPYSPVPSASVYYVPSYGPGTSYRVPKHTPMLSESNYPLPPHLHGAAGAGYRVELDIEEPTGSNYYVAPYAPLEKGGRPRRQPLELRGGSQAPQRTLSHPTLGRRQGSVEYDYEDEVVW